MKKSALVMAVTMAVLGLSACGGSDASTPAATTAAGTTAAATTAAAADTTAAAEETTAAAGDSDKVWQIVTDTAFKPFEYTDDSGKLVGIDVDILAAIADDQGFKYEIKSIGWDASIAACQAGQADGMIAGASITDERKSSGGMCIASAISFRCARSSARHASARLNPSRSASSRRSEMMCVQMLPV